MPIKKKLITSISFMVIVIVGISFFIFNRTTHEQIIRIAVPNNAQSAPIFVMDELNLLEKYIPDVKIEVTIVESGSAVNEAFIANQIDGALHNASNFLVGIDKGIRFKILTSLAYGYNSIQTNNPALKSIADITENDKIAISSLTGTSALNLYIAAEKYLGSYDALDENIVIMNNDDAMLALINDSGITLHGSDLTTRIKENENGCPTILEDIDLFDENLLNSYLVFGESFYKENPQTIDGFLQALKEAVELIYNQDEKAINLIAEKIELDKEEFIENIDTKRIKYSLDEYSSISTYIDMAYKIGLISSKKDLSDVIFNR